MTEEQKKQAYDKLVAYIRKEIDNGTYLQDGIKKYVKATVNPHAPAGQVRDIHAAFIAGCQWMWNGVTEMIDQDAEPTDQDLLRMEKLHKEMQAEIEKITGKTVADFGKTSTPSNGH